jgi:MYXO-CTERM domain-containing protein
LNARHGSQIETGLQRQGRSVAIASPPMKTANLAARIPAAVAFAWGALGASAANAELCEDVTQPASCHILHPSPDITFPEAVVPSPFSDPSLFWDGDLVRIEPPAADPGANVGEPGLDISLAAGGWGTGAEEPLVIARSRFSHLLSGTNAMWFFPLNDSLAEQWGEGCEPGTSLCYADDRLDRAYIWTRSSADLHRMVRITQTNPAPLPANATHVPVLVDYRIGIYSDGTLWPIPAGGHYAPVGGTATVSIGHFDNPSPPAGQYRSKRVHCISIVEDGQQGIQCRNEQSAILEDVAGKAHSGTLSHQLPIASLAAMQLRISAVSAPLVSPACIDRETTYGTQCVVDPLFGVGHSVADPFVYIDPSWEYASWFELEIAADETDTVWETPVRRIPFDLETLMPMAEEDAGVDPGGDGDNDGDGDGDGDTGDGDGDGDTGDGDGDTGDGDSDGDGDGPGDGDGDGDGDGRDAGPGGDASSNDAGVSDSGCGCRVGPGAPSQGAGGWLLGLSAIGIALRRRRG